MYKPKPKSQVAVFFLTFLFGPLGLFYVDSGLAWFCLAIAIAIVGGILTGGIVAFVMWFVSMVLGSGAVNAYNRDLKAAQ